MSKSFFPSIYLVRHGETDWNVERRLQGQTDIALNTTGISQAMRLAEELRHIPFAQAFSSDLSRAFQTASLLVDSRNIPVMKAVELRERNAGSLEGLPIHEVNAKMRTFFLSEQASHKESYMKSAWHPEMETSQSVLDRVTRFLNAHIPSTMDKPILVVSHGFVLRSFLDDFSFMPGCRWVIENCGFLKITIEGNTTHLIDSFGVTQQPIL